MHVFSRTPLTGSVVERNLPPPVKDRSLGTLQGVCGNLPCELSTAQLTGRNAFMLGGPRSGKSNAIKLILSKLLPSLSPDDFAVVFDPRGDYLDEFYSPKRGDLVISTLPRHRHITQGWNIFSEIRSSDPYNREMFTKDIVCRLVREDDPKQKCKKYLLRCDRQCNALVGKHAGQPAVQRHALLACVFREEKARMA